MAGARKGREPNHGSATYESNPGPTALPPATATNAADNTRERQTRATVAAARARQRSA
jgi:hypothetical protein